MRYVFPAALAALFSLSGCATTIRGHEKALFYSARGGESAQVVGSGLHWHWPWNHYVKYDLRWVSHREPVHIHSKDGMHMDLEIVVVVRPEVKDLYSLDTEAGPNFYEQVVRPAVYAATREASAQFDHIAIATDTHAVEEEIRKGMAVHLDGQHIELQDVAIQHFDLPTEVEAAVNKMAVDRQLVIDKTVEAQLAEKEGEVEQAKKRGAVATQLAEAEGDLQVEQARAKAELAKAQAKAEAEKVAAQGEAEAVKIRAAAEKARIADVSANLSSAYVRLQALDTLAKAMSGGNSKLVVVPTGKDGLPAIWGPFFNPYGNWLAEQGSKSE